MLKGIHPLLNADVLYALRAMGHGDDLVLCDTNFPAESVARQTALGRLLRIDGVSAAKAARAILSVMPLDSLVDDAALGAWRSWASRTRCLRCSTRCSAEIDRGGGTLRAAAGLHRAPCLLREAARAPTA